MSFKAIRLYSFKMTQHLSICISLLLFSLTPNTDSSLDEIGDIFVPHILTETSSMFYRRLLTFHIPGQGALEKSQATHFHRWFSSQFHKVEKVPAGADASAVMIPDF